MWREPSGRKVDGMRTSIAARAGRWSARHRKTAILGWLAFVVLATVVGGSIGQKNLPTAELGNGESKRADLIVEAADFPQQTREQVLIQGRGALKAGDPAVTAAADDVERRLRSVAGVNEVRRGEPSRDGRSVKLQCRAGMGLCQGRMCAANVDALTADALGEPLAGPPGLVSRPFAEPVTLDDLAATPPHP